MLLKGGNHSLTPPNIIEYGTYQEPNTIATLDLDLRRNKKKIEEQIETFKVIEEGWCVITVD